MGEVSNLMVCFLGLGSVFIGLISIIILCKIMSMIIQFTENRSTADTAASSSKAALTDVKIAVSAALARMLDTDISNIRITSIHQVSSDSAAVAVSAALAEMLGKDISDIHVLSFKKK